MHVLQEVTSACQTSTKVASKDRLLIESMMWLVEARVKIITVIQSETFAEPDSIPFLNDSPDTPLELAVASVRNIVGVIQYALDGKLRHGEGIVRLMFILACL